LPQFFFRRELRAHGVNSADDLLFQGSDDLKVERVVGPRTDRSTNRDSTSGRT
jgi:hypothetical protein